MQLDRVKTASHQNVVMGDVIGVYVIFLNNPLKLKIRSKLGKELWGFVQRNSDYKDLAGRIVVVSPKPQVRANSKY